MIKLLDVTLTYDGHVVFKDVSTELHGYLTLILGPNGSGKTTLCKALSGLKKPEKGRIELDGRDVYADPTVRRDIVYVHDTPVILRRSVWENIIYGLEVRKKPLDEAENLVKYFGIEDILSKPAVEMSSGYRKLISLLRAFAVKPKVLVLDEPLNHLDKRFRGKVVKLILRYRDEGVHIVVASHRQELSKVADEIYKCRDARLIKT